MMAIDHETCVLQRDSTIRCPFERRGRQVQLGNDRLMQFSAGQAYAGDVASRRPDEELGVVIFPLMSVVFVVVMIRAALIVLVCQMAVTL